MAHAEQANKGYHPNAILKPGFRLRLHRKYIRTMQPSGNPVHKLIGPYTILEKIGSKAYKLDLPPSIKLDPVFNISLLEPAKPDSKPITGHIQPPPLPVIVHHEEEWEVEEVTDSHHH
jgi:hypothetical protein